MSGCQLRSWDEDVYTAASSDTVCAASTAADPHKSAAKECENGTRKWRHAFARRHPTCQTAESLQMRCVQLRRAQADAHQPRVAGQQRRQVPAFQLHRPEAKQLKCHATRIFQSHQVPEGHSYFRDRDPTLRWRAGSSGDTCQVAAEVQPGQASRGSRCRPHCCAGGSRVLLNQPQPQVLQPWQLQGENSGKGESPDLSALTCVLLWTSGQPKHTLNQWRSRPEHSLRCCWEAVP